MRRSSKYHLLPFVVECQPNWQVFFEPIAAFNAGCVAGRYALDCAKSAAGRSEYRVMKRTSKGFVPATAEDMR
jgi:hypothetical protein